MNTSATSMPCATFSSSAIYVARSRPITVALTCTCARTATLTQSVSLSPNVMETSGSAHLIAITILASRASLLTSVPSAVAQRTYQTIGVGTQNRCGMMLRKAHRTSSTQHSSVATNSRDQPLPSVGNCKTLRMDAPVPREGIEVGAQAGKSSDEKEDLLLLKKEKRYV